MDKNLAFCENCRDDVSYTTNIVPMIGTIKGTEYHYMGKETRCAECGAYVYVPDVNDSNLKALYDEYRAKNGIISLENILEIPEKYAIGKRPLSLVLGWGEQTFSRYCEGDIPTKQYSEILTKIHDDPQYYSKILEIGKENLKTVSAYEKSKKAVDTLLGFSRNNSTETKISIAVKYLLNQCGDITPLALQKALYYIQGFYSAFYNAFIFDEDCEAWVHGPVYRDIYSRYRNYCFDVIPVCENFDVGILATQEKNLFDSIIKYFCCYSGKILEHFTHNEKPWLSARGDLPVYAHSDTVISKVSIHKYFSAVKEKYNMVAPNDIRIYAQEMFFSL